MPKDMGEAAVMRASRAYIASAGTAAVMLCAAVSMFALLSAFVAFGSWPGAETGTTVDQIVLREAQQSRAAEKVTVRADAVAIARRRAARNRGRALASPGGPAIAEVPSVSDTGSAPRQVAAVPTTQGGAGSTGGGSGGGGGTPTAGDVTQGVQNTTQQLNQQVQDTVTDVQDQVNEVIGGSSPDTSNPVGDTVNGITGAADDSGNQVRDTAGGVLGG
jgi:hypothetical protein